MANLDSNKVKIFPTPNRGVGYQPQARLVTEFNLTNIVNRLVNKDSFVISYDNTPNGIENKITFNIHGYWIEADLKDSGLSITGNLYAGITTKDNTVTSTTETGVESTKFTELVGTDDSGKYTGVIFDINPITNAGYSLKLLEKGQVPADSVVKFTTGISTTNIPNRSITIDDGDLDK